MALVDGVVRDLRPTDFDKIHNYLKEHFKPSQRSGRRENVSDGPQEYIICGLGRDVFRGNRLRISPATKKHADLIVPRGSDNKVALGMVLEHILAVVSAGEAHGAETDRWETAVT